MSDYNINGLAIPLFMVLMAIEYLYLKFTGKSLHRYNDSVTSLSMGLCLLVSDALLKAYTFAIFIYLWENYSVFEFSSLEPLTWIIFFLAVDLCYYAFHRSAHEINFLWGAHVGHHQSEEYNLVTALRQSAFQYGFSWVYYLPLAILGCPPQVFLILFILLKMYQFWLHTQAINRIPFMEGIFSTPSSHRVHHAKNPIYIDRNYGGTLVIWDRLFSSWQPELSSEPCHYGTTRPLDTFNPIKANFQHWNMLAKDTIHTQFISDKIGLWFKPTGWRPDDCQNISLKSTPLQKNGCNKREKYNPKVSKLANIYVGFSFLCIIIVAVMFIFLAPSLSGTYLAIGTGLIVFSLVVINNFLEGSNRYALLEMIRVPILFWFTFVLWFSTSTTTVVDSIIMDKPTQQVLAYASSPIRWPEWHPQSSKIYVNSQQPLIVSETFEEDIMTPIGPNHLTWTVKESESNLWVAHANNQTNGSTIRLQYKVRSSEGKTEFERRLDYTLPNFWLVVANALYYKNAVEKKSEDALQRLKTAVENQVKVSY